MSRRLTEKSVEKLRIPKDKHYEVYDETKGLLIKVTPVGNKIWMARLVYPGNKAQAKRALGSYPSMGVAAAREKAQRWYGWTKAGVDPADAERKEREKLEEARRAEVVKRQNTFEGIAEKYIEDRAANRRAIIDGREIRRMLIPEWGDKPIHEITPRHVRDLIDRLKTKAGPWEAKHAWTHCVGIFKQATFDEAIEVSPCASLDKRMLFRNVKTDPRQRKLTDAEIRALWLASDKLDYPFKQFYRLLLLTGTRVNELGGARWEEFDLDKAIWRIPRERFKSDSEHLVPLSPDALAVLETIPRVHGKDGQDGESPLLFTKRRERETERKPGEKPPPYRPISGFSKGKTELDKAMLAVMREDDPKAKIEEWVNHDLRRTLRTGLSALDVPDHIGEATLGHGKKGLQRIYDLHRFEPQIRDALNRWASHIRAIVSPKPPTGADVVPLKPKRGARR